MVDRLRLAQTDAFTVGRRGPHSLVQVDRRVTRDATVHRGSEARGSDEVERGEFAASDGVADGGEYLRGGRVTVGTGAVLDVDAEALPVRDDEDVGLDAAPLRQPGGVFHPEVEAGFGPSQVTDARLSVHRRPGGVREAGCDHQLRREGLPARGVAQVVYQSGGAGTGVAGRTEQAHGIGRHVHHGGQRPWQQGQGLFAYCRIVGSPQSHGDQRVGPGVRTTGERTAHPARERVDRGAVHLEAIPPGSGRVLPGR